jgi:hypothetical protein
MILLGVVRIRSAHQRATQEEIQDTEMAWDDSALTITVNPMEVRNLSLPARRVNSHGVVVTALALHVTVPSIEKNLMFSFLH